MSNRKEKLTNEEIIKYHGTCFKNGKWAAAISTKPGRINLGYFDKREDAAKACRKKEIELYGFNPRPMGTQNRIKVFKNRAMVYLNGKTNDASIIDLDDVNLVKDKFWHQHPSGYAVSSGRHRMHRLVMRADGKSIVDHINRNPIDNRKSNLRLASSSLNGFNALRKNEVGITFEKGKWRSRIYVNNKKIHLGRFECIEDAIESRKKAEIKYFGELAPRKKD